MVDTPTTPVAVAPATPKKSPKAKKEKKTTAGKSKAKVATHPATNVMVINAVKELKDRKGVTLQAIKKYMAATYKVDTEKMAIYIRKAVNSSVASGAIVQTKGTGASGRFKIADQGKTEKVKKPAAKPKVAAKPKTAAVKPAADKKSKSPATKKVAKPKKSPAKKPAAKPKTPTKAKKTTKVPTKKPKSPKAKTVKKAVKSPKKK